jgi:hypothetical protein
MAWVEVTDDLYAMGLNLRNPIVVVTGCRVAISMRFAAPRRWRTRLAHRRFLSQISLSRQLT